MLGSAAAPGGEDHRHHPPEPAHEATVASGSVIGRCDSCGRDGEELTAVHRIYATPESWEAPATVQRLDEVEHWCFACLSHYPHERVDEVG